MKIRPITPKVHGWLETKLSTKAMEHLWDCIETARGQRWNHKLVGHIDSSFTLRDKDDWFWDNVIKPHVKYYGDTFNHDHTKICLLYTSPSPRDRQKSRMPSSA